MALAVSGPFCFLPGPPHRKERMAFTEDQIAKLEENLASPVKSSQTGETRTEYRSVAEIKEQLAYAEARTSTAKPIRQYMFYRKSGLE